MADENLESWCIAFLYELKILFYEGQRRRELIHIKSYCPASHVFGNGSRWSKGQSAGVRGAGDKILRPGVVVSDLACLVPARALASRAARNDDLCVLPFLWQKAWLAETDESYTLKIITPYCRTSKLIKCTGTLATAAYKS